MNITLVVVSIVAAAAALIIAISFRKKKTKSLAEMARARSQARLVAREYADTVPMYNSYTYTVIELADLHAGSINNLTDEQKRIISDLNGHDLHNIDNFEPEYSRRY